ncbi:MAG: FlgD immunoglobulin-like domain containing protein [bacterium]
MKSLNYLIVLIVWGMSVSIEGQWDNFPEDVKSRKYYKRAEWFFKQRAAPYDTINVTKLNAEYKTEKAKAILNTEELKNDWQPLGPKGIISYFPAHWGVSSGRCRGIDVHPTNPDIVYLGAASGGLWKTTNGGETWNNVSSTFTTNTFGAIAVDPIDPNTVYAGTGESFYGFTPSIYYGDGVYKTTDAGSTWRQIAPELGDYTHTGDIVVNPHDNNFVYLALTNANYNLGALNNTGVWISTNKGNTWINTLAASNAFDIAAHPTDPNKVYVSVGGADPASGFYVSSDKGLTWIRSSSGLPASNLIGRMHISLCTSTPEVIYSIIFNAGLTSAYKTTNGGTTWTKCNQNNPLAGYHASLDWYDQGRYDLCISVDPANPNYVLAGNVELHKMTDGKTFSIERIPGSNNVWGSPVHCDYHRILFAPSNNKIVYIISDGGIFRSSDGGLSWNHKNNGIATIQFYCLASHPTDRNMLIGGAQDNGNFRTLNGGATNWELSLTGDGMINFYDYANPDIVYSSIQYGAIYKSLNGGNFNSFHGISPNYDTGDESFWTAPFFMHPVNPNVLYVASKKLHKSTNAGITWQITSGTFPTSINAMAQNQKFPEVMILTAGGNNYSSNPVIAVSTDEGINWNSVNANIPDAPRFVPSVKTDPNNRNTLYVVRCGFNSGKIYKTTNLGADWINISGDLPNIPHNDLIIDPKIPGTMYAANDFGVYLTSNGGINWNRMGNGMPIVPVLVLNYVEYGTVRLLRAGTYGLSAFEYELPDANFAFINMVKPYEGSTLVNGSRIELSWFSNLVDNVNIYYSKDNKLTWHQIVSNYSANQNSYPWLVPLGTSDNCFIKIEDSQNPQNTEINTLPFRIIDLMATGLQYPTNNMINFDHEPAKFEWQNVLGTQNYTLRVATDSALSNIVCLDSLVETNTYEMSGLEGYHKYYWSVSTRNELIPEILSGTNMFRTMMSKPELIFPEHNAIEVPLNVTVKWSGIYGAEKYHLHVAKSIFFGASQTIVNDSNIVSTEYNLNNLQSNKFYFWKVRALNSVSVSNFSTVNKFTTATIIDVDDENLKLPTKFELMANYPNPFNPTTNINFGIPEAATVNITIFDQLGNLIWKLSNNYNSPGYYKLTWNGLNMHGQSVSSGIYYYRIEAKSIVNFGNNFIKSSKMILMK